MNHRHTFSAFAAGLAATTLLLTACSSDASKGTTTTAADIGTPAGDTSAADDTLTVPSDVCALFDNVAVSTLLGEGVVGTPSPSGGCQFNGANAASLFPVIEIVPIERVGDLVSWQSTVESLLATTGTTATIAGNPAFVVNGKMGSIDAGQGAMQVQNLVVEITVGSADAAKNTTVMTGLFEMLAARL